jgi:hypothetical protein
MIVSGIFGGTPLSEVLIRVAAPRVRRFRSLFGLICGAALPGCAGRTIADFASFTATKTVNWPILWEEPHLRNYTDAKIATLLL